MLDRGESCGARTNGIEDNVKLTFKRLTNNLSANGFGHGATVDGQICTGDARSTFMQRYFQAREPYGATSNHSYPLSPGITR